MKFIYYFLFLMSLVSCRVEIDKDNDSSSNLLNINNRMEFLNMSSEEISTNTFKISARIVSENPIKKVSLWGDFNGAFERVESIQYDTLGEELIKNFDFEQSSLDIGTFWTIWQSLTAEADFSMVEGYMGRAQFINIERVGSWGLFIFQKPEMVVGRNYRMSFWHKKTIDTPLYIEIAGDGLNDIFDSATIEGKKNLWEHGMFDFNCESNLIKQTRIVIKDGKTVLLDDVSVREIIHESELYEVDSEFEISATHGKYKWYIIAIDSQGAVRSTNINLTNQ